MKRTERFDRDLACADVLAHMTFLRFRLLSDTFLGAENGYFVTETAGAETEASARSFRIRGIRGVRGARAFRNVAEYLLARLPQGTKQHVKTPNPRDSS